ncbi:hypothetical protein J3F83DRAFT_320406 [Trichoderma novae-zelandiae]
MNLATYLAECHVPRLCALPKRRLSPQQNDPEVTRRARALLVRAPATRTRTSSKLRLPSLSQYSHGSLRLARLLRCLSPKSPLVDQQPCKPACPHNTPNLPINRNVGAAAWPREDPGRDEFRLPNALEFLQGGLCHFD